jgi:ribose/xylose/arabinose/galactoside ABC-type transport system permease subunit
MVLNSFIVGIALLIFVIAMIQLCSIESTLSDIICGVIIMICVLVIEYVRSQ